MRQQPLRNDDEIPDAQWVAAVLLLREIGITNPKHSQIAHIVGVLFPVDPDAKPTETPQR